jgi:hypothetical protein
MREQPREDMKGSAHLDRGSTRREARGDNTSMGDSRDILTFDTSGVNALAKEADSAEIADRLGAQYFVRLTEANLAELVATKDPTFRAKLVETCQRLLSSGDCIGPHHWIIEQQVKMHAQAPASFNWQEAPVCIKALEEEIRNPRFLNDNTVAAESRKKSSGAKKRFKQAFREAREKFPVAPEERIKATLQDVVDSSLADESHWGMAADIYERYSGVRLAESEIREFVSLCPPYNALMLSTCVAQFHGSVRDHRLRAMYDAGLIDLMSAPYLPYCHWFVTGDEGQFNALTEITKLAPLNTKVMYYEDFRQSLLLAA